MSDPILLEIDDGLARLTLNRPQRLNAFNRDLAEAFAEAAIDATSRDDVGAVLIDAAGPAFCAGGDVREMDTVMRAGSELETLAGVINSGLSALTTSSVPVVTAAHGTTAGGGLGVLLSSDYAVVGANSRLGSLYANIGLTPDLSVTAQLARAVGERRALQLVLQNRLLTAEEALAWGLVAEVVPAPDGSEASAMAEAVRLRAEEVARFWLAGAHTAYGQAKRLVRGASEKSFADQLTDEATTIGVMFDTDDARARVHAFADASARKAG